MWNSRITTSVESIKSCLQEGEGANLIQESIYRVCQFNLTCEHTTCGKGAGKWYLPRICESEVSSFMAVRWINTNMQKTVPTEVGSWWRHQKETFSALLDICAGNSPVPGEFPAQRPVTRSLDVFFDLRLNKRLSKQSWSWWFETLSRLLWRHHNVSNWSVNGQFIFHVIICYTLISPKSSDMAIIQLIEGPLPLPPFTISNVHLPSLSGAICLVQLLSWFMGRHLLQR